IPSSKAGMICSGLIWSNGGTPNGVWYSFKKGLSVAGDCAAAAVPVIILTAKIRFFVVFLICMSRIFQWLVPKDGSGCLFLCGFASGAIPTGIVPAFKAVGGFVVLPFQFIQHRSFPLFHANEMRGPADHMTGHGRGEQQKEHDSD